MRYVRNDIVKTFKVKILCYAERIHDMAEPVKYLHPPSMNEESAMSDNWKVRNEEFTISDLRLVIKDGLPKSRRDELDDHPKYYRSLTYDGWCDLLSAIKVKDERKISAVHIKKITSDRAYSLYLIATNPRGFQGRRRPRLVSRALSNPQKGRTAGTMVYSIIV